MYSTEALDRLQAAREYLSACQCFHSAMRAACGNIATYASLTSFRLYLRSPLSLQPRLHRCHRLPRAFLPVIRYQSMSCTCRPPR